jgi:hypothetical protein
VFVSRRRVVAKKSSRGAQLGQAYADASLMTARVRTDG